MNQNMGENKNFFRKEEGELNDGKEETSSRIKDGNGKVDVGKNKV